MTLTKVFRSFSNYFCGRQWSNGAVGQHKEHANLFLNVRSTIEVFPSVGKICNKLSCGDDGFAKHTFPLVGAVPILKYLLGEGNRSIASCG